MKRLGFKLLLFLPLVLLVSGINYYADPGNYFDDGRITRDIYRLVGSGKPALVPMSYDLHSLHWLKLKDSKFHPQIALFGSSRGMHVRESNIGFPGFYNFSVRLGSLADAIGYYSYLKHHHRLPRVAILELSPFTIPYVDSNIKRQIRQYMAGLKQEDFFIPVKGEQPALIEYELPPWIKAFASPSYFQAAVHVLPEKWYREKEVIEYLDQVPTSFEQILFPDGSCEESHVGKLKSSETIAREALAMGMHPTFDPFGSRTEESKRLFERFLDMVEKDHVRILFYIPPYHPSAYHQMKLPLFDSLASYEEYILSVAKSRNIPVLGSTNPAELGLSETDFFDFHHLRTSGIDKVFGKAKGMIEQLQAKESNERSSHK